MKSFVVLIIVNSKSNHLGAQGTFILIVFIAFYRHSVVWAQTATSVFGMPTTERHN